MIIDLAGFIERERPTWRELDVLITSVENEVAWKLDIDQVKRLHYLYERAGAALAQINTFSSDPDVRRYLEALVARAYAVVHTTAKRPHRFHPIRWFFVTFPQTFRRNVGAFALAVAVTLGGCAFGAAAVRYDSDAKAVILPFPHLLGDPSERVKEEESADKDDDREKGPKTAFASMLMTHNIRVSIIVMALGITWGIGTIVLLFYNGAILGAVILDYVRAGESEFLAGWLLPHGSIEIPAILIAGQAGLMLASALIGKGDRHPLKVRMRRASGDLVTLIFGLALMLVWAGAVEAFLSQDHQPVLPYWLKISLGCVQLVLLAAFLGLAGRRRSPQIEADQ